MWDKIEYFIQYGTQYLKNSESNEWIKQGILNKTIASKYGAIDNIANNTAIVYDEKGDYLLIIYTEALSNSGEAIAEIADKINKLHDDNKEQLKKRRS